jgi:hypothetical protein
MMLQAVDEKDGILSGGPGRTGHGRIDIRLAFQVHLHYRTRQLGFHVRDQFSPIRGDVAANEKEGESPRQPESMGQRSRVVTTTSVSIG